MEREEEMKVLAGRYIEIGREGNLQCRQCGSSTFLLTFRIRLLVDTKRGGYALTSKKAKAQCSRCGAGAGERGTILLSGTALASRPLPPQKTHPREAELLREPIGEEDEEAPDD